MKKETEKMPPMVHGNREKKVVKATITKKEKDGRIMETTLKKKTAKIKK